MGTDKVMLQINKVVGAYGRLELYEDKGAIDGSTARRCTAIVTNERRARLRQSVKFLVRVARLKTRWRSPKQC